MKTMKKAISVLLLVCMVSALCSAGAYATGTETQMQFTDTAPDSMTVGSSSEVIKVTGYNNSDPLKVHWSALESSDSAVIRVDTTTNTLTAVKAGKATITSKCWISADSNSSYESADEKYIATKEISVVDPLSIRIDASDDGYTLTAHLMRGNSIVDNEIKNATWTIGKGNVSAASQSSNVFVIARNSSEAINGIVTVNITPTDGTADISQSYNVSLPATPVAVTDITVSSDTTTVAPGGTVHMTATVKPDNATNRDVKWSVSSNATIDESTGLVTANSNAASGDTITVTATAQDGSNVFGTGTLTVGDVKVTKINITSGNSVTVNGQLVLTAEVEPSNASNKDITWTSTDSDYVTVSGNIVTGKKEGTATITATAKDGSGVFASYKISVVPVAVESVSLNKSSTSIPAGSSETLIATVNPSTATDKTVTWTSSDVSVATVDSNGKVTAIKEGTAKITATAGGKSATCDVTVTKAASVRIDVSSNLVNNTITARGSNMVLYANVYKDNQLVTSYPVSWSITKYTSSNGLINLTDCVYINNVWTAFVTGNFNGDYTLTASCVIDNVTYSSDISVKVAYAPSIVAGNYSIWNGRDALSFLVNDHISNWSGNVWIDGILVYNAYYTCIGSSDGEIWLTLSPSLLNMVNQNNPKNSTHTLTIGDTRAAAATGYFRTWGTASSFNGVKTGDDANLGLWAALLAVSAVGAGAAVIIVKRRKTNNG